MKKILIIQNNGSTAGGVWSVNHSLALKFQNMGYEVVIIAIRDNFAKEQICDVTTHVINPNKTWNVLSRRECLNLLLKLKIKKFLISYKEYKERAKDIFKLRDYIKGFKPNFIIASHYQVLDGIPSEYLSRTINVHHSGFRMVLENKDNLKTFYKYNNKIIFCWLSKATMNKAIQHGINNSFYIYNPVKFETERSSNILENKKLITLTRIVYEKQINVMISLVEEVFNDPKYADWKLEIYGTGILEQQIKELINNHRQIKVLNPKNAKAAYLTGSINLNTSLFEGFPMSILEAAECGVPTVSFNYGEGVFEQIINNKTGYICNNNEDFKNKLKRLMDDKEKLEKFGKQTKQHNEIFHIDNVIKSWEDLFFKIEKERKND